MCLLQKGWSVDWHESMFITAVTSHHIAIFFPLLQNAIGFLPCGIFPMAQLLPKTQLSVVATHTFMDASSKLI